MNCSINATQLPVYGYIRNSSEHQLNYNIYPVGTIIDFECDKNYELIGDRKLSCLKIGQWSNSMPICKLGKL